jgi:hypothetical protein
MGNQQNLGSQKKDFCPTFKLRRSQVHGPSSAPAGLPGWMLAACTTAVIALSGPDVSAIWALISAIVSESWILSARSLTGTSSKGGTRMATRTRTPLAGTFVTGYMAMRQSSSSTLVTLAMTFLNAICKTDSLLECGKKLPTAKLKATVTRTCTDWWSGSQCSRHVFSWQAQIHEGRGVRVDVGAGFTHCAGAGVQSWHMVSSTLHGCVQQSD